MRSADKDGSVKERVRGKEERRLTSCNYGRRDQVMPFTHHCSQQAGLTLARRSGNLRRQFSSVSSRVTAPRKATALQDWCYVPGGLLLRVWERAGARTIVRLWTDEPEATGASRSYADWARAETLSTATCDPVRRKRCEMVALQLCWVRSGVSWQASV